MFCELKKAILVSSSVSRQWYFSLARSSPQMSDSRCTYVSPTSAVSPSPMSLGLAVAFTSVQFSEPFNCLNEMAPLQTSSHTSKRSFWSMSALDLTRPTPPFFSMPAFCVRKMHCEYHFFRSSLYLWIIACTAPSLASCSRKTWLMSCLEFGITNDSSIVARQPGSGCTSCLLSYEPCLGLARRKEMRTSRPTNSTSVSRLSGFLTLNRSPHTCSTPKRSSVSLEKSPTLALASFFLSSLPLSSAATAEPRFAFLRCSKASAVLAELALANTLVISVKLTSRVSILASLTQS
mmetsp:Transcript_32753/g.74004  ORF Transcript_32753/g.74004 Transcript_32753/m.74004 type:complete len:292 (-) Transcript_32753:2584-3459(-)